MLIFFVWMRFFVKKVYVEHKKMSKKVILEHSMVWEHATGAGKKCLCSLVFSWYSKETIMFLTAS